MSVVQNCIDAINQQLADTGVTESELAKRMGWAKNKVRQVLAGTVEPPFTVIEIMCFVTNLDLDVTVQPKGRTATVVPLSIDPAATVTRRRAGAAEAID